MSLVSEIKCVKCDRMYSGLRSKCPYCSTRRIDFGKYSEGGNNYRGKVLIAVLIMSVFVVATGVLLFTAEVEEVPDEDEYISNGYAEENGNGFLDDGLLSLPAVHEVTPQEDDEEDPYDDGFEHEIVARDVSVRFNNNPLILGPEGREFSMRVGESITLTVRIEPLGVEDEIIWLSSDRAIFEVTPTNPEHTEVTVRAVGRGTARLNVTVGEVTETVIVRVPS